MVRCKTPSCGRAGAVKYVGKEAATESFHLELSSTGARLADGITITKLLTHISRASALLRLKAGREVSRWRSRISARLTRTRSVPLSSPCKPETMSGAGCLNSYNSVRSHRGPAKTSSTALWLQGITLVWMLVELCVSANAAVTARSPAMMAFGSDSLVELLSAVVVLLQWTPKMPISERKAHRAAAVLLFVLAFVVGLIALGSLALRLQPETSRAGIWITIAALVAMPVLATLKRRGARRSQDAPLAAGRSTWKGQGCACC